MTDLCNINESCWSCIQIFSPTFVVITKLCLCVFLLQALRSQMQKQRSWWLLRRLYSTSQTRKMFMNNVLYSTTQRQVTACPVFSLVAHTPSQNYVGTYLIPFYPNRVTATSPPNRRFLWSRWAPNTFLLHQLLCPLLRRRRQLPCLVWLYLNEHFQVRLEIKFNVKQG